MILFDLASKFGDFIRATFDSSSKCSRKFNELENTEQNQFDIQSISKSKMNTFEPINGNALEENKSPIISDVATEETLSINNSICKEVEHSYIHTPKVPVGLFEGHKHVEFFKEEKKTLLDYFINRIDKFRNSHNKLFKNPHSICFSDQEIEVFTNKINSVLKIYNISASASILKKNHDSAEFKIILNPGTMINKVTSHKIDFEIKLGVKPISIINKAGNNYLSMIIPNTKLNSHPLYLGDYFDNYENQEKILLGISANDDRILYSPEKSGSLLIYSSNMNKISKCIDTLFVNIHCNIHYSRARIHIIDPSYQLIKYQNLLCVSQYTNDVEDGIQILKKLPLSFSRKRKNDPIDLIVIPDINILISSSSKNEFPLSHNILKQASESGVYYIIGLTTILNESFCSAIDEKIIFKMPSNSVGRRICNKYDQNRFIIKDTMLYARRFNNNTTYGSLLNTAPQDISLVTKQNKEDIEKTIQQLREQLPDIVSAMDLFITNRYASVNLLQKHFQWKYSKAANIVILLEKLELIESFSNNDHRRVLIKGAEWSKLLSQYNAPS